MELAAQTARVLTTPELREQKPDRHSFLAARRRPIHLLLDGVQRNYNLGAIFRLCDAMLVEELIICGVAFEIHKRKFIQAAQGAQGWVPWSLGPSAFEVAQDRKSRGFQLVVAELTSHSLRPETMQFRSPVCIVVGNERAGVSQPIVDIADHAVAVPMSGMCNSLNVATATAVILYHAGLHLKHP